MLGIQIGEGGNSFIRNQDFDSEMYNFISFSKSQFSYCIKSTAGINPIPYGGGQYYPLA